MQYNCSVLYQEGVFMEKILETALKASKEASKILEGYFNRLKSSEIELKAKNDYVTEADLESERAIVRTIKESFPDHSIVAEESGLHGGNEWRWFVDPLDGTKNFIHGLPVFCVSIAVEYRGEMVAAVIDAPLLNETFTAERGSGAYCNGKRIKVSEKGIESALIATGFPFRGKELLDRYLACFRDVFNRVAGIRRCGSAALDLAFTAKGVFDGFWEMHLHPWDIAAGSLLVEEAGGIVSDFSGKDGYLKTGNVIGASKTIYSDFLAIVKKHLS